MIKNLFYSSLNINSIKAIISETILENEGLNIENKYDSIIQETMKYVISNVSSIPPKGMSNEEYLFLMNKKVYNISVPTIKNNLKSKNNINVQQKINDYQIKDNKKINIQDKANNNIFDPILLKNYENLPIMEYPKPGIENQNNYQGRKILNIDQKIKTFENERNDLIPKIKPVDFSIKSEDIDKKNTMNLYNDLINTYSQPLNNNSNNNNENSNFIGLDKNKIINEYEKQLKNMDNFEKSQKIINQKVEIMENNELEKQYNSNPFNLMQKSGLIESNGINESIQTINPNLYDINPIEYFVDSTDSKKDDKKTDSNNVVEYNFNSEYNFNNNKLSQNEIFKLEYTSANSNLDTIVKEPSFDLIEKSFYVIFDSKDRDLYLYPNPVYFQVKFNPNSNNFLYKTYYDKYGTILIRERNIVYGETNDLNVHQKFDNISSINATNINIPTNTIQIGGTIPSNYPDSGSVPTNIFREPYVYLDIPELRGPYTGGNKLAYNSFAKLLVQLGGNSYGSQLNNNFVGIGTADENEFFKYDPIIHGKIDKMTLRLLNKNGYLFNFGIDKLYVDFFSPSVQIYNGFCGTYFTSTSVQIQQQNSEYAKYCSLYYQNNNNCTLLNSHPIQTGDLVYFYNTRPSCDDVVYLESNVSISSITPITIDTTEYLKMVFTYPLRLPDGTIENINVNFYNIFTGQIERDAEFQNEVKNYYIVIYNIETNTYQFYTIYQIYSDYVLVNYNAIYPTTYTNLKIGIAKKNLRGSNSDDPQSLFFKGGYYVSFAEYQPTDTNIFTFSLAYPYIIDLDNYSSGEIFFIQDKMQLSYTFLFKLMVKDYKTLKSHINDSGNN